MATFFEKYEVLQTIGTGAFSEVKIGVERCTGHQYAIKIIDRAKCKGKENMIETEVNILKRVHHDHVIQLYEMFEIGGKIYLVMELVTGGELFDEIVGRGKYTERDAAKIVHKILCAIDYLHAMGIVHRDLKPENLLLSDKSKNAKIMISDFGLSKIFNDAEVMKTACGTPGYVAPEVLKRQGYGKEVDLWALGVITYILLCGYPPFYDPNNVELFKKIMAGKYEFDRPWWDNVSEKAKDFIRHLLVLDPKQRLNAVNALKHPFIVQHCGLTEPLSLSAPSIALNQSINGYRHAPLCFGSLSSPNQKYGISFPENSVIMPNQSQSLSNSINSTPRSSAIPSTSSSVYGHAGNNLAPTVQVNMQRVQSQKSLPFNTGGNKQYAAIGRPIGIKGPLDDSACISSNEGLAMNHKVANQPHPIKDGKSLFGGKMHRITSWFKKHDK